MTKNVIRNLKNFAHALQLECFKIRKRIRFLATVVTIVTNKVD